MRKSDPLVISAIIIVVINALALLFCSAFNKNKEAERYYKSFEPIKFHVMQFCYTIVVLSLTYNARFLFTSSAKSFWNVFAKPKVITKMRQVSPTLYANLKRKKLV